ncbi:MAG: hypothetical protein ABI390_03930 [Daejeonella sp.]
MNQLNYHFQKIISVIALAAFRYSLLSKIVFAQYSFQPTQR